MSYSTCLTSINYNLLEGEIVDRIVSTASKRGVPISQMRPHAWRMKKLLKRSEEKIWMFLLFREVLF